MNIEKIIAKNELIETEIKIKRNKIEDLEKEINELESQIIDWEED